MKPKTLLITDIPFWQSGAGHIARVRALMEFLLKYTLLTIIFLGKRRALYLDEKLPNGLDLICLPNDIPTDQIANIELVRKLLTFETYKLCIIEYIQQSYFLKGIPESVITVLDAHDIVSKRNQSFASYNYPNLDIDLSEESEYMIYRCYDYIMFLSEKDITESMNWLERDRLILAPHPAEVTIHQFREKAQVVGFIGSDYLPNVDGIIWFIENVWPHIPEELGIELHIFGTVCNKIPQALYDSGKIIIKGFVPNLDDIYSAIDIVINPVRMGAGIKIKNIEALANGTALITTTHGSSGLEAKTGVAYLVADTAEDFVSCIMKLVSDSYLRKTLSDASHQWIASTFTEDTCFSELKKILLD